MYQAVSILVNLSHWFDHELKLKVDMYHIHVSYAIKYVQNRDSRPIQLYDTRILFKMNLSARMKFI